MDCRDVEQLVSKMQLAGLTPEELSGVEAHLAECGACWERWNPAYQSHLLRAGVKDLQSTRTVKDSVMARLRGESAGRLPGQGDEAALPQRIGGFEILGTLGRGGMGTVLKARQVSMDRVVALKILPRQFAQDDAFVARFIREAHAAAKLSHPHIVQGYDAGLADGYYYFAMEYVDGKGLDEILAHEGPLQPDRALQIMKQAVSALWAAHDAGVIHRDIKPSNIMLDSKDEVRVTDFGLAKLGERGGPAAAAGGALQSGLRGPAAALQSQALGTPAYLAPEVAEGKPADPRSDLYSLGAAFFHVLAGRPPFEGRDLAELVQKQLSEQPPSLATVAPHVHPRLCRIIDRLLRKDPAGRPASAKALLDELDSLGHIGAGAAAARPEALRSLMDAPTIAVGQAQHPEPQASQAGRMRLRRMAVASAIVLVLGIVLAALAVSRRGGGPKLAGVGNTPVSGEQPAEREDPREGEARAILLRARAAAGRYQWQETIRELDMLKGNYGDTSVWADNISEVLKLYDMADAGLRVPDAIADVGGEPEPPAELPEQPGEWVSLFDGQTLDGWRVVDRFEGEKPGEGPFAGGKAHVRDGCLLLEQANPYAGIACTRPVPNLEYELSLEAMRVAGNDCFCLVAFPYGPTGGDLEIGNWAGSGVGLGVVDGAGAAGNVTNRNIPIENGRWYSVRLRVRNTGIQVWMDDRKVTELSTARHTLALYWVWRPLAPLGLLTANGTSGAFRNVRVRRLVPEPPRMPEKPGETASLFDGKTLVGWRIVHEGEFAKHGRVAVADGRISLLPGPQRAGIAWMGEFPAMNYEVTAEVRRDNGNEMCEFLFPVGSSRCAWHLAGLTNTLTGLSVIDGRWANENDTRRPMACQTGQWYRARLRVTEDRIECWLDDQKWIDVPTAGRRFSQPPWLPIPEPFALAAWQTGLSVRNVQVQRLESRPEQPPAGGIEVQTADLAASAQAQWLNTGLYLKQGSRYELTAAGRWGATPDLSQAPGGAGDLADVWFMAPDAPRFALLGRIGPHGGPFALAERSAFTPSESGRLYLCMNDANGLAADNWGSLRVTLAGPMVADKDVPLLSRFTQPLAQVKLGPRLEWTRSGVELQRGDRVLITAEGVAGADARGEPVDADGMDGKQGNFRANALLARVGRYGHVLTIGRLHVLQADEAGELYLAVNGVSRTKVVRFGELLHLWLVPNAERDAVPPDAGAEFEQVQDPVAPEEAAPGDAPPANPPGPPAGGGALTVTVRGTADFQNRPKVPADKTGPTLQPIATLVGHTSWVISVAFSPDGTRLVSGSRDGTVRLWDPTTGQCLKVLRGHASTVESVAFVPDGQRVLSGSIDRTVRLWDVATGQLLLILTGHTGAVQAVAVFPDGKRAASAGEDKTLRIWDLADGRCLETLTCPAPCRALAVSRDGFQLATGTYDGNIQLWDTGGQAPELSFFGQGRNCWSVAFSPDGHRLVSAGDDPEVRVWDVATGKRTQSLEVEGMIHSLAFSPDGRYLAASGSYRVVRLWDTTTWSLVRTLEEHQGETWCLAFSPDGRRLATASFDGTVKVWALEPAPPPDRQ